MSGILDRSKFAYIPMEYYEVDRAVVKMLPEDLTLGRLIVPFDVMSRTLMVAMANPFDADGKEMVQQLLDYMHSSMGSHRQQGTSNGARTGYFPDPSQAGGFVVGQDAAGSGMATEPTLHGLFGLTQDLTDNLESYLEGFDNSDFTMHLG